jgi:hypothetical protein
MASTDHAPTHTTSADQPNLIDGTRVHPRVGTGTSHSDGRAAQQRKQPDTGRCTRHRCPAQPLERAVLRRSTGQPATFASVYPVDDELSPTDVTARFASRPRRRWTRRGPRVACPTDVDAVGPPFRSCRVGPVVRGSGAGSTLRVVRTVASYIDRQPPASIRLGACRRPPFGPAPATGTGCGPGAWNVAMWMPVQGSGVDWYDETDPTQALAVCATAVVAVRLGFRSVAHRDRSAVRVRSPVNAVPAPSTTIRWAGTARRSK